MNTSSGSARLPVAQSIELRTDPLPQTDWSWRRRLGRIVASLASAESWSRQETMTTFRTVSNMNPVLRAPKELA
jgi:hypothetical protein